MRMLLNVKIPNNEFNAAVKSGTANQKLSRIMEQSRPEAVYFTERDGQRGAILIINVENASQIPSFAEPWFLNFNAQVEFQIVMTPEDLQKSGLEEIGKRWSL